MKDLLNKFKEIERKISQEKGSFNLFALFLREDEYDLWDFVVAAPWIHQNKHLALSYIANIVQKALVPSELLQISRIVIIDEGNPGLPLITQSINIEHGEIEVNNREFFELQIKRGFIITSQPIFFVNELQPAA
jgi:hypothetical protein